MVETLFLLIGFAIGVASVILLNWLGDLFLEKYFGDRE